MPLYEYQCDSCGTRCELIRKFSDLPVQICPNCGAEGLRKLVSSPAFQFKGSGWYVTDYAKKSEQAPAAKADDRKADTKSAAKPDASTAAAEKPAAATTAPASPASSGQDKKDK
jgi:putative FmdB family regulatory protein